MRYLSKRNLFTRTAVGLFALSLGFTGCDSGDDEGEDSDDAVASLDPSLAPPMAPLATACSYVDSTGIMTITLGSVGVGEAVTIARASSASTSAILVNGQSCIDTTSTLGEVATADTLKKINITGNTGDDSITLNYFNGLFATTSSTATTNGVFITSSTGSDTVNVIGTSTNIDRIFVGMTGTTQANITLQNVTIASGAMVLTGDDTLKDITISDYSTASDSLNVNGGPGNDQIDALGSRAASTVSAANGCAMTTETITTQTTCAAGQGTVFTGAITIDGSTGDDTIVGGSGADTLSGYDGADDFYSTAGGDTITGGAGDDYVNETSAATLSETIIGGTGTDEVYYGNRSAAVTVTLGAGANDGDPTANSGAGEVDNITLVETVSGSSAADTITAGDGETGAITAYTINGLGGADTLNGDDVIDTINGGDGNDTIAGGDANDVLNGGAGNDTFNEGTAANGADTVSGDAGVDTVSYASRSAAITVSIGPSDLSADADDGAAGETDEIRYSVENVTGSTASVINTLTGSDQDNALTGGAGADVLSGLGGNDTILGGAGNDVMHGGDGDDVLQGQAGNDTFNGNAGNDFFICESTAFGADGADVFNGDTAGAPDAATDGVDTVDYSDRTAALTVTMDGSAANDGIASETDDVQEDVENIFGGSNGDTITGNDLDNNIDGGAGVDTLSGGAGNDLIETGAGNDASTVCGADYDVVTNEGGGTDVAANADCEAVM